jgi:hypothetical protein
MTVLTMSDAHIRRAQEGEHAPLVRLWERSVRATHDFLAEADIVRGHCHRRRTELRSDGASLHRVLTRQRTTEVRA